MEVRRVLELVLGTYVALVAVPAAALWVRNSGWEATPGLGALAGAVVGVAALVALLARSVPDLVDASTSLPVVAGSVLPPFAYLPYMILATQPESPEAGLAVVGLLAVLPGLGVPIGGAIVRNRRLRREATEVAVVTVGGDEEDDADGRDLTVVAGAVVMGLSVVASGVIVLVSGDASTGAVTPMLGVASTWFLFVDDETEVAVTDRGLRIDRSVTRWEELSGYRVDEEEIELVRERRFLPTRLFDREEIDDPEALIDGLSQFVPRVDEHGRVEVPPRPR